MIRISNTPADDVSVPHSRHQETPVTPPHRPTRKPRGIPAVPAQTSEQSPFLNPAEVAAMWGISHDKVLEFIKTGELEAFNVASKKSRRPQFKIPLAALHAFQERRSGRDPARALPQPVARRAPRKSSSRTEREYF